MKFSYTSARKSVCVRWFTCTECVLRARRCSRRAACFPRSDSSPVMSLHLFYAGCLVAVPRYNVTILTGVSQQTSKFVPWARAGTESCGFVLTQGCRPSSSQLTSGGLCWPAEGQSCVNPSLLRPRRITLGDTTAAQSARCRADPRVHVVTAWKHDFELALTSSLLYFP